MIYKPLNNFMIESNLKSASWDSRLNIWLQKNYPDIHLKNDSNIWECIKNNKDVISIYKQIRSFLNSEIIKEENIIRLKNLVYINCFGINIEEACYLIEDTTKYQDCLSIYEKKVSSILKAIADSNDVDQIKEINNTYNNNSISSISKIKSTLENNYRRLVANYVEVKQSRLDRSNNGITVHYLNDEQYSMIVGVISEGNINSANSYKKKSTLKSYLKKIKTNLSSKPGILCANIINQDNIGMFDNGKLVLGYEYIPIRKIIGMNTGDCFKKVNKKLVVDDLYFDRPESLINHMSGDATQVIIDMKDEPVMPTFIVAIDDIKENEADAAKILNLPIYVINSKCCYDKRRKHESDMYDGLKNINDEMNYLKLLVKLYKYQEQTYLINTGIFAGKKEEVTSRLDKTYSMIGNTIRNIYNKCVGDVNLSIKQRLDNMERLMTINMYICDISYVNNISNKRLGKDMFNCFFTEYSSHTKFMNEMIERIENKFSSKINTYALICLASLKCNLQDYSLKTCYEELSNQALDYLKYFNFKYIDLVKTGVFDKIDDYNSVRVYSTPNLSILLDSGKLVCLIYNNVNYKVVAKTDNNISFGKVRYSYICKGDNGKEVELQVLSNNLFRLVENKKINISFKDFNTIENKEYVINK